MPHSELSPSHLSGEAPLICEALPSGLTLVAEPWGSVPVVAIQVWVGAGSSSDPASASGAAHLLEHMVFKGAGAYDGSALTEGVEALGGDLNAWTSIDQTCFHVTVPAAAFEPAARRLLSMVLAPWLRNSDLVPERGVVLEEIRGADDDPTSLLADRTRAAIWGAHPGSRTVLGSVASVQSISAAALRAFHARQYHPERIALVVAGPVSPDRIRAVAREADAMVEAYHPVPPELPTAPAQRPARAGALIVCDGHEERHVEVAFPSPGPAHPDMAALDVLTVFLGDGAGSLLQRVLRDEKGVAVHAWAAMETEQQGGMNVVGAAPREGAELAVVTALAGAVAQVRAVPPTRSELERARGVVRSDVLRERETVDGRAHRLGWYWHRFGRLEAEAEYMRAIEAVTPADVQRVARAWLRPELAVVGLTTPDGALSEEAVMSAWHAGERLPSRTAVRSDASLVQSVLPGGLRVSVLPDPRAEMIGVSIIGVGGAIAEPARRAGVGSVWAQLVTRGAGHLQRSELARLVESRSASTGAWVARNSTGLELTWPAGGLGWLGFVLQEMLLYPHFDPAELEQVLDDLHIDRTLSLDDPASLAWDGVMADLYPGHAWGRPVEGTPGSLSRIDAAAVRRYHRRVLTASNLHVAVCGPVDPGEVLAVLTPLARGLPVGHAIQPSPPSCPTHTGPRARRRRVPRRDALAQVAIGVSSDQLGVLGADEAAARVLEGVLSGARGGGGRLFQRIREELGMAYSVGASWEGGLGAGAMVVQAGTDPERCGELADALWDCCVRVGTEGVPVEELERVRSGLMDGAQQDLQRSVARARHLAAASAYRGDAALWEEVLQLPARVTRAEVQNLAQRLFVPERRVQVMGGPTGRW